MTPSRYVVLVWMHDYWAVNLYTDDLEVAQGCVRQAARFDLIIMVVDTQTRNVL